MKKFYTFTITALLTAALLSGCGGTAANNASPGGNDQNVNLNTFYQTLADKYDWDNNSMVDVEGELLESFYPGIENIETTQFIAKMPIRSAVVNELVFAECSDETATSEVAGILQERIDTQAEGGAWYPESMEAWAKGSVIRQGNYVAMIACAEYQDEIENQFNALFSAS